MRNLNKNAKWITFIILYTVLYYVWILFWQHNETILTWGGNILSVIGCLIAVGWLLTAIKQTGNSDRLFWFFMFLGTLSTFLAEFLWLFYENILRLEVPFPGPPDLFYFLQIVFYLTAFSYKIISQSRKIHFVKFLFDLMIIMIVAFSFSWHFLIRPVVLEGYVSLFSMIVSLAYPVGDLALLLGIISIYFTNKNIFENKKMTFIFMGLFIQIFADYFYMYLISIEKYFSGSLIDPLFITAILFVGYSGYLKIKGGTSLDQLEEKKVEQQSLFRLLLPYLKVALLFAFMIFHSTSDPVVTIGSSISIFLVIIRQVFVLLENQQLIQQFHRKAEELEISEQRYKSLFEYHPDAVYSLDLNGRFISVNSACANLLERDKEELIGLYGLSFIENKDKRLVQEQFLEVRKGKTTSYEISLQNNEDKTFYISMTNIPIIVQDKVVGFFGVGKDITANKMNEERIQFLAYHDSLTGLANRVLFDETLEQLVKDAEANHESFAVLFIDLDNFKNINDTLGHNIGDELLVSIAKRLRESVSESAVISRNGGDEFTLLVKVSHPKEVDLVAKKIISNLNQPHLIYGHSIISTPSIGIAIYPLDDDTTSGLMYKADMAMYQVKGNGKGRYLMYTEIS